MQARHKYSERVEVVLRRSWLGEGFIAGTGLPTAALVAALPLALELQVVALAWVAAASLLALRRLRPGRRLRVDVEGYVAVDGASGDLRDGSFVAPWLAVVRWRPHRAWRDRTVLVCPDMLPAEDFRRLRVILRFGDRPPSPLWRREKRTKGTDLAAGGHGP